MSMDPRGDTFVAFNAGGWNVLDFPSLSSSASMSSKRGSGTGGRLVRKAMSIATFRLPSEATAVSIASGAVGKLIAVWAGSSCLAGSTVQAAALGQTLTASSQLTGARSRSRHRPASLGRRSRYME